MKHICLFTSLCYLTFFPCQAQVTRGWQPGEIYLSSPWYYNGQNQLYSGIFYSKDNGRTLGLCYKSLEDTDSMPTGTIISDASPGVLYCDTYSGLFISHNYGKKWRFVENIGTDRRYTSGIIAGELFKYSQTSKGFLYKSMNYGNEYNIINNNVLGFFEVGIENGEIYNISPFSIWPILKLEVLYSNNSGETFSHYSIDSLIQGIELQGHYTMLTHGNLTGEMYLVSWHLPANYKIFRSTDFGQHFNLQYTSDTCNFYFESYDFTAGKAPGSFYIVKYDTRYWGDMTEVTIYHSSDSARSFTSYVHHLDTNWVDTASNSINKPLNYHLNLNQVYPNPANDYVTFNYNLEQGEHFAVLEIYSFQGLKVGQYKVYPLNKSITINLCDIQPGIYLYQLKAKHFTSPTYKLIKN